MTDAERSFAAEPANSAPPELPVELPDCRSDAYEPVLRCIGSILTFPPEEGVEITFENLKACTGLSRNKLQVPIIRLVGAGVIQRKEASGVSKIGRNHGGPSTTVSFVPTEAGAKLLPPTPQRGCRLRQMLADPLAFLPPERAKAAECIRCMLTRGIETIETDQVASCSGVSLPVARRVLNDQVAAGHFSRTTVLPGLKHGTIRPAFTLTEKGRYRIAPRLMENCPQERLEQELILSRLTPKQQHFLNTVRILLETQQQAPNLQIDTPTLREASGLSRTMVEEFIGMLHREGYLAREPTRTGKHLVLTYAYRPTPKAEFLFRGCRPANQGSWPNKERAGHKRQPC